jgi:serine/threonine protein kinase
MSPNNILLGVLDQSVFTALEQAELDYPSPRKILADRTITVSRNMPVTFGSPVICDFGAAKVGDNHSGDVMPGVYRAPEIILGMEWDSKIDIWSIGVMVGALIPSFRATLTVRQIWDLFEGGRLFRAVKDGYLNDEKHLAEMVSLMGPPPLKLLDRSENKYLYWDAEGMLVNI